MSCSIRDPSPQEFSILTLVVAFFFSSISSIIYILPWKHVLFSLTNLCNFIHTRWFTTSKEMVAIYSRNSQCCSQENLVLVSYEIHTIFGRYLCLATQCARTIWMKGSYLSQWLPQSERRPPKESKSRWIEILLGGSH